EMEASAIGKVAEIEEIPMIIVKGVQDYADYDKNDQFREYAAEVSARFLLAFLTTTGGYKKIKRSPIQKNSNYRQLLDEERAQTYEMSTPIKIDNSIIIDYNLHDLVGSFRRELEIKTGREGVLAFNIFGKIDQNILQSYIIERIKKILENDDRELYRLIDIKLRDSKIEEEIEFYLKNRNICQTIADLFYVDKSSEVTILVIWNSSDFYEKQIHNRADSFVRQMKTKFSDSLTKEGKYLIIIFGHDKRECTLNDEIFTPLAVTPFNIDDLCRWFKKKLRNKTEESKINKYLERLKRSKGCLIDTCDEIREIIAELQGRYNNESARFYR
ncbi:MAG: 5'-methylthioadenosine/S-adenosylhomocysteine nucleosidase, partial [Okeania sp. SIO3C4]|nr:5'-methylthioadenosine/S-adenosylhomocysteine nucleosidase [Okeania sp. SIO3C4]